MEEIPPIELYDNPEVLVRFVPDSGGDGFWRACARPPPIFLHEDGFVERSLCLFADPFVLALSTLL